MVGKAKTSHCYIVAKHWVNADESTPKLLLLVCNMISAILLLVDRTISVTAYFALFCSVHIIVATPGRILDLLNKDLVKTDACKMLVLDEVSDG